MKEILVVDVDEVLLEWVVPFKKWVNKNYDMLFYSEWPEEWFLGKWLHHPNPLELVEKFNNSKDFQWLPSIKYAEKSLEVLSKIMPIVAITGCGLNNQKQRLSNLEYRFSNVKFCEVIHVKPSEDKLCKLNKVAEKYPANVHHWVEDNPWHALDGHWVGMNTFYLKNRYTKKCKFGVPENDFHVVHSWKEIVKNLV